MRHRLLLAIALLVLAAATVMLGAMSWWRGQAGAGAPAVVTPGVAPELGANVDLLSLTAAEQAETLDAATDMGIRWLRQRVLWSDVEAVRGSYDWEASDEALAAAAERGLPIIVVLVGTPQWARPDGQEEQLWTPPANYADFGDFCAAFASRYGDSIDYYEVWDEPNIYPHWGDRYVDAAEYSSLLREASTRIRAEDESCWILLAGLAPNVEDGPLNLNEMEYLRQVYRSGGAAFFDIVAAKPYGLEYDAGDQGVAGLAFRRVESLRQVMEEWGDTGKPIWAVEFGWSALRGDEGDDESPWPSAEASLQAARGLEALRLARQEWPWMGPLLWSQLRSPNAADDPRSGFALLNADLEATSLGADLLAAVRELSVARVGHGTPDAEAAAYTGEWRVTASGADPSAAGDSVEIAFAGTAIDLIVRPGPYWAVWYASVDGRPASSLPREGGRSYLVLYDPLGVERQLRVAEGLAPGEHTLRLVAEGGWQQWPLAGWVSWDEGEGAPPWALPLAAAGMVVGAAGLAAFPGAVALARRMLQAMGGVTTRAPAWIGAASVAAAAMAFWAAPGLTLSLACGGAMALAMLAWPAWGAAMVAASLPFFLLPKDLVSVSPSLTEVGAWLLFAVSALRRALAAPNGASGFRLRLHHLDLAVLLLVTVSSVSLCVADNHGVAATEFRQVILSAAVYYLALRLLPGDGLAGRMALGLTVGAALASVWSIGQAVTGTGLIEADGVARVRAAYGSPNNLALYLERVIPVAGAVVLYGASRRRRLVWLAGLVIMLVSGGLTRSRGLVLLGLPVAGLCLAWRGGWLRGRRWLVALAAMMVVVAMAMLWGRLGSLLGGGDQAAGIRVQVWEGAVNMVRDHPLFGVGLDNFLYQYRTRYILPSAWREPNLSHPHNIVLDAWTRLGIGGVVALSWLLLGGWRALRRARPVDASSRVVCLGIEAAIVGAIAHGLVDNSFFLVDLSHVLLGMLAIAVVADPRRIVDATLRARVRDGALTLWLDRGGRE